MKRFRSVVLPTLVALLVLPVSACGQEGSSPVNPGASTGPRGTSAEISPAATTSASTPAPTGAPGSPGTSPTVPPAPGATGPGSTGAPSGVTNGVLRTVKAGDVTMSALMGVGFPQFPAGDGIRRKAGLLVEYAIVNHGQQRLAVYDLVPADPGSATEINPEHAWVYMHDRSLRVSKQSFSTAAGVDSGANIRVPVTGSRLLAAGATLTGRAWVPLPPKLDVPGGNFASPGGRGLALDIFTWQFCVQVGGFAERGGPVPNATPGPIPAPVDGTAQGGLLCTTPGPLPSA